MVFRCVFVALLLINIAGYGQNACIPITKSYDYYSASATNPDENEARIVARSLLIEQISATISSRSDLSTKESTDFQSSYSNQTTSVSQLYMSGIQYITCARDKRTGISVLAYISKEDLEKSRDEVSRKTGEYLELMEQKRLVGADYLPDGYTAYLHTFLTPYPIAYSAGSIKTNDARTYLESFFVSVLSKARLTCTGVEENKEFPEQLSVSLKVDGIDASSIKFVFDCPEFNARCEAINMSGKLNVLMDPVSSTQTFKGVLTLRPSTVSSDLIEVNRVISLSREIEISADMKPVISVDFSIQNKNENVLLIPTVRHLSVRTFEWVSDGHVLSADQRPFLSRKDVNQKITLTVNGNADLSITRNIDGSLIRREVMAASVGAPAPALNPIAGKFIPIEMFSELQPLLSRYKKEGKVSFGKKTDFLNPSNCWIFLVSPGTKKVMYFLTPENAAERTDVKSNKTFTDFETQIRGLTSIWAEFY